MKKIAGIGLALLTIAMLAVPVMAIGPNQAFDVGNNKNLVPFGSSLGNLKGNAGGSIYWFWVASDNHWVRWEFQDAGQANGLMNNAIVAPQYSGPPTGLSAYFSALNSDELDNQWIYLSGDGGTNPSQYNGHGMLYWFTFGVAMLGGATNAQAAAAALGVASTYPSGEMWRHNDIFAPQ